MKGLLIAVLITICNTIVYAAEKQEVYVYVYHLKPPLITDLDAETGIYFDFSSYMNSQATSYTFKTVYLPRKRLEKKLAGSDFQGVLLGVNPIWFKDKNETKYLWTPKIISDRDEVVSNIQKPINYTGPPSLNGKKLGGVLGFYYFGIDELVKAGDITRKNTKNEKAILSMIIKGRVDVGIVSRSTLEYLIKKKNWQDKFYLSPKPHDVFDRRILVPHHLPEVHKTLVPYVENLEQSPSWQAILDKY